MVGMISQSRTVGVRLHQEAHRLDTANRKNEHLGLYSATITSAIENDPDIEVKKKAVFALSQMPKDEGVPKLIEVAQNNRNPAVRKQAMFWLGQSNDPRALQFFEKVLSQ